MNYEVLKLMLDDYVAIDGVIVETDISLDEIVNDIIEIVKKSEDVYE